jgi:hypothetical protein
MARKRKVLKIGTRVRIKGDGTKEGYVKNWLVDEKKAIVGYLVEPDNEPFSWYTFNLDDDRLEVLE